MATISIGLWDHVERPGGSHKRDAAPTVRQVQYFTNPSLAEYSIPITEDKQGAIKLTNNPLSRKITRHIAKPSITSFETPCKGGMSASAASKLRFSMQMF